MKIFVEKIFFTKWNVLIWVCYGLFLSGCGDLDNPFFQEGENAEGNQIVLNGAGATFPSPVYNNWSYNYTESTEDRVLINYQGIGSGAGISQVREGTVDFAGTDAPLTENELQEFGLIQFPMLAGGVVVIVNLPGFQNGELRLSQQNLADIFLGKIKNWNDSRLAVDNPGRKFPDLDISVIHRSDSSGTTFLFTHYLSQISDEWKQTVGEGKTVDWPIGIGGQKNPGVCNNVSRVKGSIGYTEYTYAIETNLASVLLENASGKFILPTESSFSEVMKQGNWEKSPGYYMILTNAEGEKSYPIMGITYLLYKKELETRKKEELCRYFLWCFDAGKKAALKLHYVPVPDSAVHSIKKMLEENSDNIPNAK